jgi:hypothetical protein
MQCPRCHDYYDDNKQSVACPHSGLIPAGLPRGGFKLPADVQRQIEEAFHLQDEMSLYRFMGHGNPAARAYAQRMSEMLDKTQHVNRDAARSFPDSVDALEEDRYQRED